MINTISKLSDEYSTISVAEVNSGILLFAIDKPNCEHCNQGVHFVVYRDS